MVVRTLYTHRHATRNRAIGCGACAAAVHWAEGIDVIQTTYITVPAITTIAHLIAAAIGIGIFYVMRYFALKEQVTDS